MKIQKKIIIKKVKIEKKENIKEPFAKIVSIAEGSPAEEAGLKTDDNVILFNKILYKEVSNNPLGHQKQ